MKKKLIGVILLLSSNSYAGLCYSQFGACVEELSNVCAGVTGSGRGAEIVRQLCTLGSQQYCYQDVVKKFGPEQCEKEYKERQEQEEKDSEKKFETKEKTK